MRNLMQMEILDGESSEESFKDMILDDDNNGSDSQYNNSNLITSKANNIGVQFIERISISNTNVVQKLFPHSGSSIIDNTKMMNQHSFESVVIQGKISEQNDLSLNKQHTQDDIEVANSDYLHKNKSSKVQCSSCNKFFGKKYIKEHMRRHRGEGAQNYDKCKQDFQYPHELKRHGLIHDDNNKSLNSQCSYCKKTVRKKYIDQHMRRHKGEGSYKCGECKNYYQSPSELKRHYQFHENKNRREANLKCEVCEQSFRNYSELLNHIQMHSDNSYKCDKCEKGFSRNDLLEEHVKYSHIKKPIQRMSVIQKVADVKVNNPVTLSIQNKLKPNKNVEQSTIGKDKFKNTLIEKVKTEIKFSNLHKIPHTDTYNTVGLLMSASFLSREEIREQNADEVDLGNLNLDKLLKLKKFLADTLYDKIDKTEETIIGDKANKIVRAKVVDQHLVLTNIDMDNLIKMESLMMEELEDSYKGMFLEDDYYFILDTNVAPEIRVLISILILKNAFVCSYVGCLTTCRQRTTMANHYMTHLGIKIKPFKCDWSFCEKHFSKSSALEQHKKNHIDGSVLNQFKCISCEETFRHRSKLQKHIIIHQELITSSSFFRKGNGVEDTTTSSSPFRQRNKMEEPTISSSNFIFRWRNEMEDHINESEEEDEVEAWPKKIELVCSHQDCHHVFSSQWKLNMHKMSDH